LRSTWQRAGQGSYIEFRAPGVFGRGVLAVVTRLEPLSYGIDGLRDALIVHAHIGVFIDVTTLAGIGAVFALLGAWAFSRIQV
jgi:ABC-type multidrug transport system permease subunit